MQFEPFGNRRITICKANKSDLESYMTQLEVHHVSNGLDISEEGNNYYYLKIEDISQRLIGIIRVNEINRNEANVDISIPNEAWNFRYGTEAVHQFVKCCKERKLYKKIKFEESVLSIRYKVERPEMFENDNIVIN